MMVGLPTGSDERHALIEANLDYVQRIAKRFHERCRCVELEDLVSCGIVGLIQAVDSYESERGDFSAFARFRIAGAMQDFLRGLDWMPRRTRTRLNEIDEIVENFTVQVGRPPTRDEIANSSGLTRKEVEETLRMRQGPISLDRILDSDSGVNDVTRDRIRTKPDLDLIKEIGRSLSQRERLVILLYYWSGLSMREIGLSLKVSESRVSQIHAEILKRLSRNPRVHEYLGRKS